MRVLISITFLIVCYFLSACQHTASEAGYQAIGKYSKKANKEWGWELCGVGGQFGDTIQRFNLDYELVKQADVQEARELIVKGVNEFLEYVNTNEKTRPLLIESPFTSKRLKFGLGFIKPDGSFAEEQYISYALVLDGKIHYSRKKPNKMGLESVHSESFEEASKIIQNKTSSFQHLRS